MMRPPASQGDTWERTGLPCFWNGRDQDQAREPRALADLFLPSFFDRDYAGFAGDLPFHTALPRVNSANEMCFNNPALDLNVEVSSGCEPTL